MILQCRRGVKNIFKLPIRKNAFRQKEIFNSISHNDVVNKNGIIDIKNIFAEKNRVGDAWRYKLIKNDDGEYATLPHASKDVKFTMSKFNDLDALDAVHKPIIAIVIESPHKNEYTTSGAFLPIGPAQGQTGKRIEKYFSLLFSKQINSDNQELHANDFNVVICNPIQFQSSLFELHKHPISHSGVAAIRDNVWIKLMELERSNFEDRLCKYKPKIIINACTSKLKSKAHLILTESKASIGALLYTADSHPCVWNSNTKFRRTG